MTLPEYLKMIADLRQSLACTQAINEFKGLQLELARAGIGMAEPPAKTETNDAGSEGLQEFYRLLDITPEAVKRHCGEEAVKGLEAYFSSDERAGRRERKLLETFNMKREGGERHE